MSTQTEGYCLSLEEDLYKLEFKYYKARQSPPDLSQVLDVGKDAANFTWRQIEIGDNDSGINSTVKVCEVVSVPGLLLVPKAFTPEGLHRWTHRSLLDFPERPNVTNLETLPASVTRRIGESRVLNVVLDVELRKKLRWTTLGYHHDWNSKVYDLANYTTFPSDLARCAAVFAEQVAGYAYEYQAEAAIVNYYPVGTTLSGHVDHSEEDLSAPLVSISLGCTAIFLIGGTERSTRPTPIFLRHGDVALMTGASRLAYHGVPRVFIEKGSFRNRHFDDSSQCPTTGKWETDAEHTSDEDEQLDQSVECKESICFSYLKKNRININIRQVHKPDI
ncbi:nucleic acid dioxygenase ALKBH1-like isoform X1 [Varroa jacobsoni]|uniref:nucleic acid dioxygenase ALKBH1-like isoform X1 n=1 Tax=Varroa jacobsoni TaxID=62625 RepID=UPI000BF2D37A|nr:nucleic acid dioxygenase ALKBH1-like isoform X1 [Varroa jacobsoni]